MRNVCASRLAPLLVLAASVHAAGAAAQTTSTVAVPATIGTVVVPVTGGCTNTKTGEFYTWSTGLGVVDFRAQAGAVSYEVRFMQNGREVVQRHGPHGDEPAGDKVVHRSSCGEGEIDPPLGTHWHPLGGITVWNGDGGPAETWVNENYSAPVVIATIEEDETGEVALRAGATTVVIPDHRLERATLEAEMITAYGDTSTVLDVEVTTDDGDPLGNALVRVEVANADGRAGHVGVARSADGSFLSSVDLRTNAGGVARAWLRTSDLFRGEDLSAITVRALHGMSEASVELEVIDNLEELTERFEGAAPFIPYGAMNEVRSRLRGDIGTVDIALWIIDSYAGNPLTGESWRVGPNAPNEADVGTNVFCQEYQHITLVWLNALRHDRSRAWILNGLDYGPVQWTGGDHHYVVVYAASAGFDPTHEDEDIVRIFDPWPSQQPATYTYEEYDGSRLVPYKADIDPRPHPYAGSCVRACTSGGETTYLPPYYPSAGGPYPYYPENEDLPLYELGPGGINLVRFDGCQNDYLDACQRELGAPYELIDWPVSPADPSGGLYIGSPVVFHLAYPSGGTYGIEPDGALVSTYGRTRTTGFMSVPEANDERGWYVDLPEAGPFRLTLTATGAGTMSVVVLDEAQRPWGAFVDVPIEVGEVFDVEVDPKGPCVPLISAGRSIDCYDPGPGRGGEGAEPAGCGCRTHHPSSSLAVSFLIVGAALVLRRRRATNGPQ